MSDIKVRVGQQNSIKVISSVPSDPTIGNNGELYYNNQTTKSTTTNFVYEVNNQSVGIGTTLPTSKLTVVGNALISGITTIGLGTTSTPPNNSQLSFELISDTQLRIKVRGSDGNLRSANITLS